MERLPLEFVGERNFPDIVIESIEIGNKKVRIVGEMLIESSIDHTLVEGFSELVLTSKNQAITFFEKVGTGWESTEKPDLKTVYLISCGEDGTVSLEGYSSTFIPTKMVIPNGAIRHKYL